MKTLFQLPLTVLSAAIFIAGCCTKPCVKTVTTSGGAARVKIHTTDVEIVRSQLVGFMTNGDFRIQQDTSDHLVFSRPVNATSGLFDRPAVDSSNGQEATYEFTLSQSKSRVTVTADAALTSRNAGGEATRENMNRKWATDLEHALLNVKAVVEGQPHQDEIQKIYEKNKGRVGVAFDGAGYIIQLTPNGAGARAGLKPGDRIIAVNHWPFSDDIDDKIEQMTGKPGSSVRITVVRDGQKMSFKLKRE